MIVSFHDELPFFLTPPPISSYCQWIEWTKRQTLMTKTTQRRKFPSCSLIQNTKNIFVNYHMARILGSCFTDTLMPQTTHPSRISVWHETFSSAVQVRGLTITWNQIVTIASDCTPPEGHRATDRITHQLSHVILADDLG